MKQHSALNLIELGKKRIMKILRSFLYSILPYRLTCPCTAVQHAQTGKIHGHVTNYTGQPMTAGIISLATDGVTPTYSFPIDTKGNYAGEAPAGTYTLLYRMPDTPLGQWIDQIHNIVITAGSDLEQNDDMSRAEFHQRASRRNEKELEDLKKHNMQLRIQGKLIKAINSDLQQVHTRSERRGSFARALQLRRGQSRRTAEHRCKSRIHPHSQDTPTLSPSCKRT